MKKDVGNSDYTMMKHFVSVARIKTNVAETIKQKKEKIMMNEMNCEYCSHWKGNCELEDVCVYEPSIAIELKSCPFCGEKPKFWVWNGGAMVECAGEGHRIQCEGKTKEEAAKFWNNRA